MNKKELIERIKEDADCSDEEAEDIFQRAVEGGMVKRQVNWRFINRYSDVSFGAGFTNLVNNYIFINNTFKKI